MSDDAHADRAEWFLGKAQELNDENKTLRKRVEELEAKADAMGDLLCDRADDYRVLLTAVRNYIAALDAMTERGNIHDAQRYEATEAALKALLAETEGK